MKLNILLIDDHPLLIDGYKSILQINSFGYDFDITEANSCEKAYGILTQNTISKPYDVIFIDVKLPPYPEKKLFSGEDVAVLAKAHFPTSKIMILTSHDEAFILQSIIDNVNPEGLLIKSDFTSDEFLVALQTVLEGETYYTQTVKKHKLEKLSKNKLLDTYNRQIIVLLAQGIKTKNLQDYLHLSVSAIDKRKAIIKQYFGIEKGTDEDIIREARKEGYI